MSEFLLRHLGRDIQVRLDDRGIELLGSDNVPPRRIELDAIRSVRLARIGTLEACVLGLDAGREHTLATDEAKSRPAFAAFVRSLYPTLSARGISFVSGSPFMVILIAISCAVTAALGVALYLGILDVPEFRTRGLVLALVSVFLGPIGAFGARPKTIRNEAELSAALPKG